MKHLYALCLSFFISSQTLSWTLINSGLSGFQTSSKINVYLSSNTCQNAGYSRQAMENLIRDVSENFWNTVSTSSLELVYKGIRDANTSASDLTDIINNNVGNNEILIGCSADATTFTSGTTLAVGSMVCISQSDCRGGVLLNDTAGTLLDTSDINVAKAVFAHELGHALGLGHTSENRALMYYSLSNKTQKALHQDDIDAIQYLYPAEKKVGGLGGACGSVQYIQNPKAIHLPIDEDQRRKEQTSFIVSMLLGIVGVFLLKKLV